MSDEAKQVAAKQEAVHWLLRTRAGDMDEIEWDAFTRWLEVSSDHAIFLDEAEAADDWTVENTANLSASLSELSESDAPQPEAANDNQMMRFLPLAGMVAAAVAIFALWPSAAPTATLITTQPGETQTVAVSDEIVMTLNGGSKVTLVEAETRVQIARGEVSFAINADEPSPLRVEVADLVLTDYGTIFNVVLNDASVSVAVAEGIVGINPENENVQVQAGEKVTKALDDGKLVRERVDSETVGTWSQGRLEFDNTPAQEAVAMLERSIGSRVTLAEVLKGETLTGTLIVSEDDSETVAQFAEFLGAQARPERVSGARTVWDVR
ncbi:MAG: FecR domain-containing protein [Erythrobacter sp.]|uniref:FecR family protein n=1 Tax=Erythrobacter sp. TaxID=1042 RepID=UPI00326753BB